MFKPAWGIEFYIADKGTWEFGAQVYGWDFHTDDYVVGIDIKLFKLVIRMGRLDPPLFIEIEEGDSHEED